CFSLEIPLALGALDFAGCDEIASFLCQAARRGADQAGSDPAIDRLVADPQLGSRLFRRVHPLLAHASLLVATVDSVDYIKERLKSQPGVWRWLGSGAVRGHNAPSAIEQRDCCTCGTAIFCAPSDTRLDKSIRCRKRFLDQRPGDARQPHLGCPRPA